MTIAEILVVVAVLGILMIITIPNFNAFLRSYRAQTAVDQMVSIMNAGRQRAITEQLPFAFLTYANPQNRWALQQGATVVFQGELPDGVTITTAASFAFLANGSCPVPTGYTGTTPTSQFIQVDGSVTGSRTDRWEITVSAAGRMKKTLQRLTS